MFTGTFDPTVRVQILDDRQIKQIHNAALEILERTGIAINSAEARKILLNAGCKRRGDNFITIPSNLVDKALETAPSSVTLYDRLGQPRCVLEGWKTS